MVRWAPVDVAPPRNLSPRRFRAEQPRLHGSSIRWSATRRTDPWGKEVILKKHPAEEPPLRLFKKGLGDAEVAEKLGIGPNFAWAIRASSGLRPVTAAQERGRERDRPQEARRGSSWRATSEEVPALDHGFGRAEGVEVSASRISPSHGPSQPLRGVADRRPPPNRTPSPSSLTAGAYPNPSPPLPAHRPAPLGGGTPTARRSSSPNPPSTPSTPSAAGARAPATTGGERPQTGACDAPPSPSPDHV